MCTIDFWTPLGTWAAVVLALGFFVWDKVERRWREAAEGRLLAILLRPELMWLKSRTADIANELGEEAEGGWAVEALAAVGQEVRGDLADSFGSLSLPILSRSIERLHVLRKSAAVSLVNVLERLDAIKISAKSLGEMSPAEANRRAMDLVALLRAEVRALRPQIDAAMAECERLAV